jgi:hypothetical protein
MENIMLIIEPYLTWFLGIVASSGIVGVVGTLIYNKLAKKVNSISMASDISNAVVNSIVNKELKISLETFSKKQIDAMKKEILSTFEYNFKDISDLKQVVAPMAVVMSNFKLVTPEQKTELISSVNKLQDTKKVVEVKSEPIVVKIEQVEIETEKENDDLDLF